MRRARSRVSAGRDARLSCVGGDVSGWLSVLGESGGPERRVGGDLTPREEIGVRFELHTSKASAAMKRCNSSLTPISCAAPLGMTREVVDAGVPRGGSLWHV